MPSRKMIRPKVNYATPEWHPERAVIVGCGGIGSHLAPIFMRELYYRAYADREMGKFVGRWPWQVKFVDADVVESKNLFRQDFFLDDVGRGKAEVTADRYRDLVKNLGTSVEAEQKWIDKDNNPFFSFSVVLSCVDNNATRLMLSEMEANKNNGCVAHLSAGNDGPLATLHLSVWDYGERLTPPITYEQPDIANPEDKHPKDASCMDETSFVDDPQVFRANHQAATMLNNAFWSLVDHKPIDYHQLWGDVYTMNVRKQPIPAREKWENE